MNKTRCIIIFKYVLKFNLFWNIFAIKMGCAFKNYPSFYFNYELLFFPRRGLCPHKTPASTLIQLKYTMHFYSHWMVLNHGLVPGNILLSNALPFLNIEFPRRGFTHEPRRGIYLKVLQYKNGQSLLRTTHWSIFY